MEPTKYCLILTCSKTNLRDSQSSGTANYCNIASTLQPKIINFHCRTNVPKTRQTLSSPMDNIVEEDEDPFMTSPASKHTKRIGSASLPWERYDKKFSLRGRSHVTICLTESEQYLLSRQMFTGLDFSQNKLTTLDMGLFTFFPHLISITKLDLSCNEIENLPLNMDVLRYLTHLDLHCNNIKALVPCVGKMKNLVWFNINRNPINSLVPGFRKVVGSMATDQDCRIAAQRVVSWMAGQLKTRADVLAGDEKLLNIKAGTKERMKKRGMRDLCGGSRLVESASEKLIVIRPDGCAPFAAQVLDPPEVRSSGSRKLTDKQSGHSQDIPDLILWPFFTILISSLILSEQEFTNFLSNFLFFLPGWFISILQSIHITVQSVYRFWLPGLFPIGWSNLVQTSTSAYDSLTTFLLFGGPDPNSFDDF